MSPILVTLTSRSDSNFERSDTNLKENKRDGVDSNYSGINYDVRKNEGKYLWFSADCTHVYLNMKELVHRNRKVHFRPI